MHSFMECCTHRKNFTINNYKSATVGRLKDFHSHATYSHRTALYYLITHVFTDCSGFTVYLNVGTPLSALTPDPVSTTTFFDLARISRNARILPLLRTDILHAAHKL